VNIRPQHFTGAFLFDPIDVDDPDTIAVMEEHPQEEEDQRPGAKKGQKIRRSYYVLSVIHRGEASPRYKFWFDRTGPLDLVRKQLFGPNGLLVGDVKYSRYLPPEPVSGQRLPVETYIVRTYEEYALRITLNPDTVIVNRDIPQSAFSIEAPAEWGESLRRIDLDQTSANQVGSGPQ
jgi:hypothetical protein